MSLVFVEQGLGLRSWLMVEHNFVVVQLLLLKIENLTFKINLKITGNFSTYQLKMDILRQQLQLIVDGIGRLGWLAECSRG